MKTSLACFALSLLTGSAAAFAPNGASSRAALQEQRHMAFEDEIGAQPPIGFWDPLGLLKNADQARFDRLRYVETKHGRIAMLAVLGHIVTTAGVRLPGDIDYHGTSFADIPSGLGALTAVPAAGWLQMFFFVGVLEIAVMKDITGDGEWVGDFRNDFIDFVSYNNATVLYHLICGHWNILTWSFCVLFIYRAGIHFHLKRKVSFSSYCNIS